jgi:hypothetical protein
MSRAEKALRRIVGLCRQPNHRVTRQLRLLEIALEGLGASPAQRDLEVKLAIQVRRDLIEAHCDAPPVKGGSDAPP